MSRSLDAQVLAVNVQRDGLSPPMARSYERQGLSSDNINMGIDNCKFSLLAGTKRCISFPAQQGKYVLRYVFDGRDWIICGLLTNNRLSPRWTLTIAHDCVNLAGCYIFTSGWFWGYIYRYKQGIENAECVGSNWLYRVTERCMPVRMRLRDRLLQFRCRRCLLQQVLFQRGTNGQGTRDCTKVKAWYRK